MSNQNGKPPAHFIVIVPGFPASTLRDKNTKEIVWVNFKSIPLNPLKWGDWLDDLFDTMTYPNDQLEPAGIMEEILILPPWIKQEEYGRLLEALEDMGYKSDTSKYEEEELNVYTFPYDWRQDNRISGRQLGEAIENWSAFHDGAEAWIIAHSNGGIVSRWYIEKEGGKDKVGKLILMGSPWDGAPKIMHILFAGLELMFRRSFNPFNIHDRTRDLFRSFPSTYQLIPVADPFLRDASNNDVDPFLGDNWLTNSDHKKFLQDGRKFTTDLGTQLSVETLCFFGRKKDTHTHGVVHYEAGGSWREIEWHETESGDGTIAERSAVHPNANAKLPFLVGHGDIYVDPAVLGFLEWELMDKYGLEERAILTTETLNIQFETDKEIYEPGESIKLWGSIAELEGEAKPVSGARIQVRMKWRQQLPGSESTKPPASLPTIRLWESESTSGRYEGEMISPDVEGYYEIIAAVSADDGSAAHLSELIVIEAIT